MKNLVVAALSAVLLAACASQEEADNAALLAADGRDIAEAQCAGCHAVGPYGESPRTGAPPFRTILSRYSGDVLEEELINGIRVSHPMPEFQFNPQSTDALLAYLRSVQEPAPAQ